MPEQTAFSASMGHRAILAALISAMSTESKSHQAFSVQPREFAQARARRTYEALLSAAEQEFSDRGYDATQTPDVARRAGVSVGTFYRYFEDKKEVLLEVLKRDLTQGRDMVLSGLTPERLAADTRRQTIETALTILLENTNRNPGLERVFKEMSLRDEDVAFLRSAYEDEACRRIAAVIASVCSPEEVADPLATAYVILISVVECASVAAGSRGPTPLEAERSMRALTELVFRAVFARTG